MSSPFETPHNIGIPPWWLRDPSDEELVTHRRLMNELSRLESEWIDPEWLKPKL